MPTPKQPLEGDQRRAVMASTGVPRTMIMLVA